MADFIDIPIDVTAEQIAKMAKRQVDTVAKKGSGNLITSDAVANVEIDGDNILPKSVDTEHLATSSVTTPKINDKAVTNPLIADNAVDARTLADNSVDNHHIKNGAVTDDKLADGAVTSTKLGQYAVTPIAIQPNAVTRDAIGTGAVTSEKIASGAVTEDKLADNCIDVNHLKWGAVSPDNLDRAYVRLNTMDTVVSDSSFHTLLIHNADELSEPFKKVVLFLVRPISEGITANIKKGRCFGFFVSNQEFWFTNINYNITYRVTFNENSLLSLESLNKADVTYNPESEAPQSGKAVAEALLSGLTFREVYTIRDFENYNFKDNKVYALRFMGSYPSQYGIHRCIGTYQTKYLGGSSTIERKYFTLLDLETLDFGEFEYYPNESYTKIISLKPDSELSDTSQNSVQNKVVAKAINNINSQLGNIDTALDELHTYAQGLITGGAAE